MPLSLDEGRRAVLLARKTLEARLLGTSSGVVTPTEGVFAESRGVFVTLNLSVPGGYSLRGCIGYPYPVMALGEAIKEATIAAATEDPRFEPVSKGELGSIKVEVSVLTVPRPVQSRSPAQRAIGVRIGVDGLIVSLHGMSGLLLPQVATDFGLDQVEFISQACMKAGLPPDAWLEEDTEVKVFQAEIFSEDGPRGEAVKVRPASSSG